MKIWCVLGLDEAMQFANVRLGQMGLRGFRPYVLHEYAALATALDDMPAAMRRKHELVIANELPGMVSSNALFEHWVKVQGAEDNTVMREPHRVVELNYEDFVRGSVQYDLRVASKVIELAMAS